MVSRCGHGFPRVIAVAPLLGGRDPFPTTFWLTCPYLVASVHALESEGAHRVWAQRLAGDPAMARRAGEADAAYRQARESEGGGSDPCGSVGFAGQADVLAVKCLHARVAAVFAGIGDPVGEGVLAGLEACAVCVDCSDVRCAPRGVGVS